MTKNFSPDRFGSYSSERVKIAALLLKALAILGPFAAINDYLHDHLITAICATIISVTTPLLLHLSHRPEYRALPLQSLLFLLLILFIAPLVTEPLPEVKSVWEALFVVGFYFVSGKRTGTILSVIAFLFLSAHFLLHPWLFHLPVPVNQMSETMGAFLLAAAIAYSYEHIRSKHEDELRSLATLAEEASRAKSDFLSNMSHEIRTPMNSVLGMTVLALNSVQEPKQRDYLEKIRQSGEQMLSIIDDILDFAKIEAGKMHLVAEDFDLESLFNSLVSLLDWRAGSKGLRLRFEIDPAISQRLNGDAQHLNQALLNLTNNAIKFTERGEVIVRARILSTLNNIQRIRIEVQDTGIGIAEEQQALLFQAFHQVDAAASRKVGGTGLGLAISKSLIELMGGEIGVESKPGQGSTFWFTLPLRIVATPADTQNISAIVSPVAAIRGARILLVENNEINQQVATEFLERAGAKIFIAENGQQALDILDKATFDCVLMDMQMPVMDGLDATRRIRANKKLAGTLIIALTASASRDDAQNCLNAGMDDFISKPIRQEVLYSVLAHHLAGKPLVEKPNAANIAPSTENDPSEPAAIFDWDKVNKLFGDDQEKLSKFLQKVLDSMQTSLHGLEHALQKHDMQALLALAHDMKGAASIVGANGLFKLCIKLEEVAKHKLDASQEQEIMVQLNGVLTQMMLAVSAREK